VPRFIADVMVGKLARWLRVLGFEVAYSNKYEDDEIIRIAEDENRVILTRDTGLNARPGRAESVLIESGNYEEQIQQVLRKFALKEFDVFSRCLECNATLENVDKEAVFEKVFFFAGVRVWRWRTPHDTAGSRGSRRQQRGGPLIRLRACPRRPSGNVLLLDKYQRAASGKL